MNKLTDEEKKMIDLLSKGYELGQFVAGVKQLPGGLIKIYVGKIKGIMTYQDKDTTYLVSSWIGSINVENTFTKDVLFLSKNDALNYLKENIEKFIEINGE